MGRIAMLMGMPRAATTFMYHHFDSHPDIFVPYKRKTNYFSLHFKQQPSSWFFEHFAAARSNQVSIDTETIGFVDKHIDVIDHIEQVLEQDSRFILCVREPGEWLYSLYRQVKTFEKQVVSFEDFIAGGYRMTEDNLTFRLNYQNGDIKDRINTLIARFNDRLLLIDYREVQNDPNQALVRIEQFLSLSPYFAQNPVTNEKINASDRKNIRLFTALMRNHLFIRCISLLPVGLVKTARKLFDKLSSSKGISNDTAKEQAVAYARTVFADDVAFYLELFDGNN